MKLRYTCFKKSVKIAAARINPLTTSRMTPVMRKSQKVSGIFVGSICKSSSQSENNSLHHPRNLVSPEGFRGERLVRKVNLNSGVFFHHFFFFSSPFFLIVF